MSTNESFLEGEKERFPSQRELILNELRAAKEKGLTNQYLTKHTLRLGARIKELKQLGYEISVETISGGLHRYKLLSEPEVENLKKEEKAIDIICSKIKEEFNGVVTIKRLNKLLKEHNFQVIRKPSKRTVQHEQTT